METNTTNVNPWQIDLRDFPASGTIQEKLAFLLRYTILAPSTRNTQPWKFAVLGDSLALYTDLDHWQQVADPDQRELYMSMGCALENLLIAAEHFGFHTHVRYCPNPNLPELAASVQFTPSDYPVMRRP